ncbi:MAG: alpha/beta hydrolase [Xanthomonadales bacterium PRO7]|jgi:acetyl esterase/lipase|nr:alpha/beta hydrolase [Xanthomonadales bacterium PRO7]HMM57637.1 alpha/beta hydrolase [Rudaea sp.]
MNTIRNVLIFACLAFAAGAVGQSPGHWRGASGPQARRSVDATRLPPGTVVLPDQHYAAGEDQTFDVYAPPGAHAAPVIFMVHGGGWKRGDKAARGVVENKVSHWLPKGFVFVSVDYPMLPDATPLQQATFVGKALAVAQREAPSWGGDPHAFVLMGHSAGAHLVSLISAEPRLATSQGALPWLGTVALDSAAFNVTPIMQSRHLGLYDNAFGSDPAAWSAASPIAQLHSQIAPFLAVCSSRRADSCAQARAFADKAKTYGSRVDVLPQDLRHGVINKALGEPGDYTAAVDAFLASLAPSLGARLH